MKSNIMLLPSLFAFCGFYVGGAKAEMFNNATEVVLMRHGTTTVLSMENNYQGPPDGFAMVVPVPTVIKQDQVKTLPRDEFDKIDTLGAPRLVEYWEQDPCYVPPPAPPMPEPMYELAGTTSVDDDEAAKPDREYHVHVEARFAVGEYNIEVLSAQQSTGLDAWLRDHHYQIPPGAEPLLRPYIETGSKWFVAKVDPKKVTFKGGMATLSPLRFSYDSQDFTLPIRLGLANSNGTQDLIVNVLAPTRYEVANYPNITIPTNLTVDDAVRTRFAEFYAALFDHAIAQKPGSVVTEYSWQASSCDPCPGPTLDGNDLQTFGADVMGSNYKNAPGDYTLTRLHARYGKDISNDLVFRSVDGIIGGTGIPDPQGEISTKVVGSSSNNFQGRYVIMHPWQGAISCAAPHRGIWGGPPAGAQQQIATQAATNLAFAPRGKVELASLLTKDVPEANLLSSKGQTPPIGVPQTRNGCGCQSSDQNVEALVGIAAVGLVLRRRRR
ncbi:MAG: DUF2330 domain-containing protein [Kofleriaceae bacterium]